MRSGVTALRMLLRDWRGGELGIVLAALVLAVAVVSGISAFTARLQSALERESHRFLAADLVVQAARPMPSVWFEEGQRRGLSTAAVMTFTSMVHGPGDELVLASVKAVSDLYPLRGQLAVSAEPFGQPQPATGGPPRGTVWLDSRLFPLLGLKVGDRLGLGDASFKVGATLRSEPDRGSSLLETGPRVLMHSEDVPATKIVQPGSRVRYRQLYAGEEPALAGFREWLGPRAGGDIEVIGVDEGQPRIGAALDRAESFLLLAGSLAVVLAAVAVALASRRFSERHRDYVAILKSLGATRGAVAGLYGRALIVLGLLATLAGCGLGWGLQAVFIAVFAERLPVEPGPSGWQPYLTGAVTTLVTLLCFAWPPLLRLAGQSPLRVLRRDVEGEERRYIGDLLLGFAAVAALMGWYSADLVLTAAVIAGLSLTALLGAFAALCLLRAGRAVGMRAGSVWRLALAGLQRRGLANALQVVVFAMALLLLLVLTQVRTSLIGSWREQLPEGAPNHFVLNIAPEERSGVEAFLRDRSVASEPLFPMVRGRVMEVDGTELRAGGDAAGDEDPDSRRRQQREANFTWSSDVPSGNELVAGRWWSKETAGAEVSLEQEFAERLGASVGDRLGLRIGSERLEVTVSSLRKVDWQSMQPNFFMVFPPAVLDRFPATFMTSFHLDDSRKTLLNDLLSNYPTVSVIEMDMVLRQLREIIDQVAMAIEIVLALIILAGALVLVAGVQSSLDERIREAAVLRALGARRGRILGALFIEFAALGLAAGVLAVVGAELSVAALEAWVLELEYRPTPLLWPLGTLFAMALIAGIGLLSSRRVVVTPPLVLLRVDG